MVRRAHVLFVGFVVATASCGGSSAVREGGSAPDARAMPTTDETSASASAVQSVEPGRCFVVHRAIVDGPPTVPATLAAVADRAVLVQGGSRANLSVGGESLVRSAPVGPGYDEEGVRLAQAIAFGGRLGIAELTASELRLHLDGGGPEFEPIVTVASPGPFRGRGGERVAAFLVPEGPSVLRSHVVRASGSTTRRIDEVTRDRDVAIGPLGVAFGYRTANAIAIRTDLGDAPSRSNPELDVPVPADSRGSRARDLQLAWAGSHLLVLSSRFVVHTGGRASNSWIATWDLAAPTLTGRALRPDDRYVVLPRLRSDGARPVASWIESDGPLAQTRSLFVGTVADSLDALSPEAIEIPLDESDVEELILDVSGEHAWVSWVEMRDAARTRHVLALRCGLALF